MRGNDGENYDDRKGASIKRKVEQKSRKKKTERSRRKYLKGNGWRK